MHTLKVWVEAMRLRTLPVSVSGVIVAAALSIIYDTVNVAVLLLCLIFAMLAQVASNFANEYYDFKAGLDAPGRVGPRRGVTEGDITPRAMKIATFVTLALACAVGCSLIYWGGWWLIAAGAAIALGVLAYSTGPFPLSRNCLGEVAVIFFFGIVPVNLTLYVEGAPWAWSTLAISVAVGLMGANVLLVNNYRDIEADRAVGKHTLAVVFGRHFSTTLYLLNGWVALWLMGGIWAAFDSWAVPMTYGVLHTLLWYVITRRRDQALNPLLGATSMLMFLYSIGLLVVTITSPGM